MGEVKTWWAYFSDWKDLSKGVIQKEQWALMLNSNAEFQVVDKQAYDSLQSDLTRHKGMLRELAEEMKEAVAGRDQWRKTQLENIDLKSKLEKAVEAFCKVSLVHTWASRESHALIMKQIAVEALKQISGELGENTQTNAP